MKQGEWCACRYRYGRGYSYGSGYSSPSYPSYSSSKSGSSYGGSGGSRSGASARPRWSRAGSTVSYTPAQVQSLTPVREAVERVAVQQPDLRDCFLCHAWPDRQAAAKELDDALKAAGVKTWFSELDLGLGVPMMRTIDRGLANSRIGLVLVTPNFIKGLPNQGVADKELSALLAGNRLVPIVHETTYDELRNVSPLLASRTGLDTKEDTMAEVAAKIAEPGGAGQRRPIRSVRAGTASCWAIGFHDVAIGCLAHAVEDPVLPLLDVRRVLPAAESMRGPAAEPPHRQRQSASAP